MDFRANAAEKTFRLTQDSSGAAIAALDESGCVKIEGGRKTHCLIEIPFVILSFFFMSGSIVVIVLLSVNVLSLRAFFTISFISLFVGLFLRIIKSQILKSYLRLRSKGLLSVLKELPAENIAIENGQTYKKIKFVVEDEGVCLLDAARQRLLVEGCSYRYIIYARDVYFLEPISGYSMSGARIKCRMAGEDFDAVIMARGHGPIASLVQTVSPGTSATTLASRLAQTLFGSSTPTYYQTAEPPLLPK